MGKHRIGVVLPGLGVVNRGTERFFTGLMEHLSGTCAFTVYCCKEISSDCKRINVISRKNRLTNFLHQVPGLGKVLKFFCLDPLSIEMLSANISAFIPLYRNKFDLIICLTESWGARICKIIRVFTKTPFIVIQLSAVGKWEILSAKQKPNIYVSSTLSAQMFLKNLFPDLPIVTIPRPIDLNKFSCEGTVFDQIDLERPVFLAVGAFDPGKRMELAIRAVARLEKGSLLILGTGQLKDDLMQIGKTLLGPRRFLLKTADADEIPAYYRYCDVFTLPSAAEGFANVYLEAMACNKPIVTHDDEIRKEIIGDAGFVCDCADIKLYAAALNKAANNNFNDQPRKRAEKFGWERITTAFEQVFSDIIENNRRSCV